MGSRADQRARLATTSLLSTGSPSWNFSPGRRRKVQIRPSSDTSSDKTIWRCGCSVAALRTTYWVPHTGSKFARLAWGTKRKVRAAAPWERAGIERPPVAARLPTPANPFNRVLRSIELYRAPNEVKRASQTDGDQPPLLASGMPARPARSAARSGLRKLTFSSDHINLRPGFRAQRREAGQVHKG